MNEKQFSIACYVVAGTAGVATLALHLYTKRRARNFDASMTNIEQSLRNLEASVDRFHVRTVE